ncbi:MAG: hypothetical protein KDA99_02345, partial [Planctomycetales bacterium]|nr:hypothetical protein [Planctomycetales bacterium]
FDVQSTSAATSIDAAAGNDTFNISSDAPTNAGNLDTITATLTITGGDDDDSLILSDAGGATANANVVITDSSVTGLAGPADDVDVLIDTIEAVQVVGNASDESFSLQPSSGSTRFDLSGGDGDDLFDIRPMAGIQARIDGGPHSTADELAVEGQTGLPIDDGTKVTVDGTSEIQYVGIETVTLTCATCAVFPLIAPLTSLGGIAVDAAMSSPDDSSDTTDDPDWMESLADAHHHQEPLAVKKLRRSIAI